MILTYALCNFANFGSLGILVGGIAALAPERKTDALNMGFKAMLAGLLTGFFMASMVGVIN